MLYRSVDRLRLLTEARPLKPSRFGLRGTRVLRVMLFFAGGRSATRRKFLMVNFVFAVLSYMNIDSDLSFSSIFPGISFGYVFQSDS